MSIIAIDGGTTNTRLTLVRDGKIVCRKKLHIGAGNGGKDGNKPLEDAVSSALSEFAETEVIELVIASGMIGSELGLLNVPHIEAPVTVGNLAEKSVSTELFGYKFFFIPGVICGPGSPETAELASVYGSLEIFKKIK